MTNNSIIFKNVETGEAEKTLTPPDIERSIHLNLVLLLKNAQKEIISVKDYVKTRFLIIPNYKTQSGLSNRILTFIAENYEQVFVPDILLRNQTRLIRQQIIVKSKPYMVITPLFINEKCYKIKYT